MLNSKFKMLLKSNIQMRLLMSFTPGNKNTRMNCGQPPVTLGKPLLGRE